MKISLLRHTTVELDGNIYCYGNTDLEVSNTFLQEAAKAKDSIAQLAPDAIFTSPLKRATQLAEYCGYPNAIRDARIKELNFGDWEKKKWLELFPEGVSQQTLIELIDKPAPGGESLQQLSDRVQAFLDEKRNEGHQHILLFCHGGVINCIRFITGSMSLQESFLSLPPFATLIQMNYN